MSDYSYESIKRQAEKASHEVAKIKEAMTQDPQQPPAPISDEDRAELIRSAKAAGTPRVAVDPRIILALEARLSQAERERDKAKILWADTSARLFRVEKDCDELAGAVRRMAEACDKSGWKMPKAVRDALADPVVRRVVEGKA